MFFSFLQLFPDPHHLLTHSTSCSSFLSTKEMRETETERDKQGKQQQKYSEMKIEVDSLK